jgi:hypothetical protein
MRKLVAAAALAAGVLGLNFSTLSAMAGQMVDEFGPVHEMKMKDHMAHMQVIKNKAGQVFVVIPMADAEIMYGKIPYDAMTYTSAQGG